MNDPRRPAVMNAMIVLVLTFPLRAGIVILVWLTWFIENMFEVNYVPFDAKQAKDFLLGK